MRRDTRLLQHTAKMFLARRVRQQRPHNARHTRLFLLQRFALALLQMLAYFLHRRHCQFLSGYAPGTTPFALRIKAIEYEILLSSAFLVVEVHTQRIHKHPELRFRREMIPHCVRDKHLDLTGVVSSLRSKALVHPELLHTAVRLLTISNFVTELSSKFLQYLMTPLPFIRVIYLTAFLIYTYRDNVIMHTVNIRMLVNDIRLVAIA